MSAFQQQAIRLATLVVRHRRIFGPLGFIATGLTGLVALPAAGDRAQQDRSWLAGDHHIHSHYSVGWNDSAQAARA